MWSVWHVRAEERPGYTMVYVLADLPFDPKALWEALPAEEQQPFQVCCTYVSARQLPCHGSQMHHAQPFGVQDMAKSLKATPMRCTHYACTHVVMSGSEVLCRSHSKMEHCDQGTEVDVAGALEQFGLPVGVNVSLESTDDKRESVRISKLAVALHPGPLC